MLKYFNQLKHTAQLTFFSHLKWHQKSIISNCKFSFRFIFKVFKTHKTIVLHAVIFIKMKIYSGYLIKYLE